MLKGIKYALLIPLAMLSFACSQKSTFVLLPDLDGAVGEITVTTEKGSTTISEPMRSTTVTGPNSAPSDQVALKEEEIQATFGEAMAAQPEPGVVFILYFKPGSKELVDSSAALINDIIRIIADRKSVDTSVVGHADTAGNEEYNKRLSTKRAEAVAGILSSKGVDTDILKITSHGENDPLIQTGDNVSNRKNRRVEVTVR